MTMRWSIVKTLYAATVARKAHLEPWNGIASRAMTPPRETSMVLWHFEYLHCSGLFLATEITLKDLK